MRKEASDPNLKIDCTAPPKLLPTQQASTTKIMTETMMDEEAIYQTRPPRVEAQTDVPFAENQQDVLPVCLTLFKKSV